MPLQGGPATITFEEIERLAGSLPVAATSFKSWWTNDHSEGRHVQARAWLNSGREVEAGRPGRPHRPIQRWNRIINVLRQMSAFQTTILEHSSPTLRRLSRNRYQGLSATESEVPIPVGIGSLQGRCRGFESLCAHSLLSR